MFHLIKRKSILFGFKLSSNPNLCRRAKVKRSDDAAVWSKGCEGQRECSSGGPYGTKWQIKRIFKNGSRQNKVTSAVCGKNHDDAAAKEPNAIHKKKPHVATFSFLNVLNHPNLLLIMCDHDESHSIINWRHVADCGLKHETRAAVSSGFTGKSFKKWTSSVSLAHRFNNPFVLITLKHVISLIVWYSWIWTTERRAEISKHWWIPLIRGQVKLYSESVHELNRQKKPVEEPN